MPVVRARLGAPSITSGRLRSNFCGDRRNSYNQVAFYTGAAGGGSQLFTVTLAALPTLSGDYYTGQDLSCGCTGTFFDLVTFTLVTGPGGPTDIGSVVLSDTGQAAFEFGVSQTPLPAALPLFAGGLGLVGLLAQRREAPRSSGRIANTTGWNQRRSLRRPGF